MTNDSNLGDVCGWCGAQAGAGERFCLRCGRNLSEPVGANTGQWFAPPHLPGAPAPANAKPSLKLGPIAWVALTVVVVVALIAAGSLVLRRGSISTPDADRTSLADPSAPLPEGAYAHPADPALVVDRVTALKVVETLWPMRASAVNRQDTALMERIETGTAREIDTTDCGCDPPPQEDGGAPYAAVLAAQQDRYPASFLALVNHKNVRQAVVTDLLVFTRADANSSWLIDFHTQFDGTRPLFATGSDQNFLAPPPSGPDSPPEDLPGLLVDYWQSWKDTGAPPTTTPLVTVGYLETHGKEIATVDRTLSEAGIDSSTVYRIDPSDGRYQFGAGQGGRIVCGTIRWDATGRSPDGRVTQSASRQEFGRLVAPGIYREVRTSGLRNSCSIAETSGKVHVWGETGGDTYAETLPL